MKVQRGVTEVLDDLEILLAELRELNVRSPKSSSPPPECDLPNPRRFRPFNVGDRVVILSRKHQNKKATVTGQKTEDFWNVVLDDGTKIYRKYTTLRHL